MQVFSSPRRWTVIAACLVVMAVVGWVFVAALRAPGASTMLLAGPVCLGFLAVVIVRAVRARVELRPEGGVYRGFVRTRQWGWGEVRFAGRQSTYAFGSTGSTPELTLRGGRHLVLVALADPRHPDAEEALIAAMRERAEAYKAAHPSAVEQIATLLREQSAGGEGEGQHQPE